MLFPLLQRLSKARRETTSRRSPDRDIVLVFSLYTPATYCFPVTRSFWFAVTTVSAGKPSAEDFDRLSPRQLVFLTRVPALLGVYRNETSRDRATTRFPRSAKSSAS